MAAIIERFKSDGLRWWSVVLGGVGLLDSAYLSWVKLAKTTALCTGVGDCESVNSSIYSEMFGIPVALFGLAVYLAILAVLLLETRAPNLRLYALVAVFGMALTGTLYSAYLTYVELFVIHAVCPYCVVSAVMITLILILSSVRLARQYQQEPAAG